LVYFRHETLQIVQGALHCLIMRPQTQQARLFLTLCVATFPVILFGFMFSTFHWGEHVRSIAVIGWTTVIYAVILYIADRWGARAYSVSDYRVHDAILMGFAQVLALIPGTSRSGIVFTAARLLGYERVASAQLALLMGIPTLLASTTQGAMELAHSSDVMITKTAILAASLSFIFALITLRVFMRIISKFAITGFVIYRLFLGGWLLWIVYGPPL
jgi:undecaprenyl-diphosphatase